MDPDRDSALFIAFCRDLVVTNFGDASPFESTFGADGAGYTAWIRAKLAEDEGSAVFACAEGKPVGMVVIGSWKDDATIGYVHHYYLCPDWRGRGFGEQMDDFAMASLARRGYQRIRLSAVPDNVAASRFYARLGWRDAGPRNDQPGVRYLERIISAP
jgi:ribosomal protein S18 acetylase RimI-like enzyme